MDDKIALSRVRKPRRLMKTHQYLFAPPSKVSDKTVQHHAWKSWPADNSEKTVVPHGEVPAKELVV